MDDDCQPNGIPDECNCGDDVLDTCAGEECDDGNTADGDCCDSACQYEDQGMPCDDDVYCNGVDTCDGQGTCIHPGDPCAGGEECNEVCNEESEDCYDPPGTHCGDGPTNCSDKDTCDGAGHCDPNHLDDRTSCYDGEYCTVYDQCVSGVCQGTYQVRIFADIYPVPDGDGAVEGFDILCVLDAANGLNTYGCLTVLPSGYKAGDIYPCDEPDNAIEGFDRLAVLDAANDIWWCSDPCPPVR